MRATTKATAVLRYLKRAGLVPGRRGHAGHSLLSAPQLFVPIKRS
ncbi:hypothetical protein ACFVX3_18310 [Rhodococcus erythropolis]